MAGAGTNPNIARLTLVCHAATPAVRMAVFSADEGLDANGRRAVTSAREALPKASQVLCSPALRARETAEAFGLSPNLEPALRDCDYGRWAGSTLAEIAASEPDALGLWLADPDAAPHGGESLASLLRRVADWLDSAPLKGRILAVTHPAVIRAAVVHVLEAPPRSFWRIDAPPLSMIELRRDGARWAFQAR